MAETARKTLTVSELKPADVLLTTSAGAVSSVIRFGTNSKYSHTALYVGNGQIIEAIEDGVRQRPLEAAVQSYLVVEVYRPFGLSPERARAVIQYAQMQAGKPYDFKAVATAGHNSAKGKVLCMAFGAACEIMNGINRSNSDVAFYCSELVAHAFVIGGGYSLRGGSVHGSTPQNIAESKGLGFVGILKDRPAPPPAEPKFQVSPMGRFR